MYIITCIIFTNVTLLYILLKIYNVLKESIQTKIFNNFLKLQGLDRLREVKENEDYTQILNITSTIQQIQACDFLDDLLMLIALFNIYHLIYTY